MFEIYGFVSLKMKIFYNFCDWKKSTTHNNQFAVIALISVHPSNCDGAFR